MVGITPRRSFHRPNGALHLLVLLLAVVAFVHPHQAGAANDWCSKDPVIAFKHGHSILRYTVDMQVQVPLSALPVAGTATLDTLVPANVSATVVDVITPGFEMETRVSRTKPHTISRRYDVDMALFVPASATAFPVRVVITDPQRVTMVVFEGVAGEKLEKSYEVGF